MDRGLFTSYDLNTLRRNHFSSFSLGFSGTLFFFLRSWIKVNVAMLPVVLLELLK